MMTILLKLFVLSFLTISSGAHSDKCQGLECKSKKYLLGLISHLQKEKHDAYMAPAKHPSIHKRSTTGNQNNPECSICSSPHVCLNGGTCVADSPNPFVDYHCICPENTSGKNCENMIECKSDTCGENSNCLISNHQVNCLCKPGYTAKPNSRDCDAKVRQSCIIGDPHFTTFDGLNFDYQGTCPYIFSQPCKTLKAPFSHYSVRAKNEMYGVGSHVSIVSEVEIDMHGFTIHVDQRDSVVLVNQKKVVPPWWYPNKGNWIVRIRFTGREFIVDNDQGVTVTLTRPYTLCIAVPDVPEFYGKDTLCGLAGNIDGNPQNDVVNTNGTTLTIGPGRQPQADNYVKFMEYEDSWLTNNFVVVRKENCQSGRIIHKNSDCDNLVAVEACSSIQNAISGEGPFKACKELGRETLQNFYESCFYDVCHDPNFKCQALTQVMQSCQSMLPKAKQDPEWRKKVDCPLPCPVNSHHSICATSCPSTCSLPNEVKCDLGCSDGCECDPGYVVQTPITDPIQCVRPSQCGCIDENGILHEPDSSWLTNNCTITNKCQDGSIFSSTVSCAKNAYCAPKLVGSYCECEDGYESVNRKCISIDKCKKTPGICGKHGTCSNTRGSYQCTCDDYYNGKNCENYSPRRHCADLYVYWKNRTDGVYTINPPYALPNKEPFAPSPVYCDMTTDGGGFTLISSDVSNLNENKTYGEYIVGFGSAAKKSVWLGLEIIHQMTTNQTHTLRLNLDRCASNGRPAKSTYCTYSTFSVLDASTQYSVVIRESCEGTEAGDHYYRDGWARWDLSKNGPKFSAYDLKENKTMEDATSPARCSEASFNTGWWFTKDRLCGAANLNGVRYTCPNIPEEDDKYLRWGHGTLAQASMYLRPAGYPNYDSLQ